MLVNILDICVLFQLRLNVKLEKKKNIQVSEYIQKAKHFQISKH